MVLLVGLYDNLTVYLNDIISKMGTNKCTRI